MAIFQYQILVGMTEPDSLSLSWFLNGNQSLGADLLRILNNLGSQGWEVAGIGDLGFNRISRSEILLKKQTQ